MTDRTVAEAFAIESRPLRDALTSAVVSIALTFAIVVIVVQPVGPLSIVDTNEVRG